MSDDFSGNPLRNEVPSQVSTTGKSSRHQEQPIVQDPLEEYLQQSREQTQAKESNAIAQSQRQLPILKQTYSIGDQSMYMNNNPQDELFPVNSYIKFAQLRKLKPVSDLLQRQKNLQEDYQEVKNQLDQKKQQNANLTHKLTQLMKQHEKVCKRNQELQPCHPSEYKQLSSADQQEYSRVVQRLRILQRESQTCKKNLALAERRQNNWMNKYNKQVNKRQQILHEYEEERKNQQGRRDISTHSDLNKPFAKAGKGHYKSEPQS